LAISSSACGAGTIGRWGQVRDGIRGGRSAAVSAGPGWLHYHTLFGSRLHQRPLRGERIELGHFRELEQAFGVGFRVAELPAQLWQTRADEHERQRAPGAAVQCDNQGCQLIVGHVPELVDE